MDNYFGNTDWYRKRLGRFTSSEIYKLFASGKKKGDLFGQGALTYIRSKVAELLTLNVKEEIDFKQAEWGKAHELEAVLQFEKVTGKRGTYYGVGDPQFFPYGEYAGGSPDWERGNEEGADIKCPYNSAIHVENLLLSSVEDFKQARWEYYCQGQMNMLIRGWKQFHFVSYDPRMIEEKYQLKVLTIYPDQEWIDEFQVRLAAAIELVEEMQASLDTPDNLILIAHHDTTVGITVVEEMKN